MMFCLCCKTDVSGSGPIPEKSQTIQSIIACTNIKPFNPEKNPNPFHLQNPSLRKAQQMKTVQLLITSEAMVSHEDFAGGKPI